jgi:anthranilate phosphoribosyltransferase
VNPGEPFGWTDVLGRLVRGEDLPAELAESAMRSIMSGGATDAQIAAFVMGLRVKGETVEEITGLVRTMRALSTPVEAGVAVVDTCGTGGDRAGTFNVSTVAALVVAGTGTPVAKHGNRAASGRCGSADLLEAWGGTLDLPPGAVAACIDAAGIGFCFAPSYHPAIRHAMPARRELGVPTVFNFLGPLTNPARARHQTIGVSDHAMAARMAAVLARLGTSHALVFHGDGGLDELTTTGPSHVWEVRGSDVEEWVFDPADHGVPRATIDDLRGGDVADNRRIADAVLRGEQGPPRDIVVVGAAAALLAADVAEGWDTALAVAAASIDSGAASAALEGWVAASNAHAGAGAG